MTIYLDSEVARWLKLRRGATDVSVSEIIESLVARHIEERDRNQRHASA